MCEISPRSHMYVHVLKVLYVFATGITANVTESYATQCFSWTHHIW